MSTAPNSIEEIGLREGIDFERMYYTGPIGTPIFNGLYYLSLDSAVAIARQRDDVVYEEWQRSRARQLAGYLLDCRAGLGEWESGQPEPLAASSADEAGFQADPDDPLLFHFDDLPIRVVRDEQGRDWWCAKDVCDVLGYANPWDAVKNHCKPNGIIKIEVASGLACDLANGDVTSKAREKQMMTFINDPNFYRLIAKSKKPEAERFERWVFEVVVPTVNKTGRYVHPVRTRDVQPVMASVPAETLPTPSFTDRQEKIAAKPAKAKAIASTFRSTEDNLEMTILKSLTWLMPSIWSPC